jgi:mevalonate kinase
MSTEEKIYYAKILLFGEYSVIKNSMALTIPYSHFNGELSFLYNDKYTDYDFAKQSNRNLYDLLGYLKKLNNQSNLNFKIDTESFAKDLEKGLYFESSIPEGYGIGSSGALIAAIYEKYLANRDTLNKISTETMSGMKKQMATLESFYHGTSSGIDPLNALIKKPLLFKGNGEVQVVDINLPTHNPDFGVFLINTGGKGITSPLVNIFLEKTSKSGKNGIDTQHLNNLTNNAIMSIIEGKNQTFFKSLAELSAYQLEHFAPMIPEGFRSMWKKGLNDESYYLKLCGSGGGGFILGFTNDFPGIRKLMKKKDIEINPVYVHELSKP